MRRTFGSLDTHNYRLYFVGDLVSHVGGWMQTMAEAWLVFTLTHSGVAVGATFAFRFLPVLLFGLWGGAVADRFDRRKVLLVTQSLAALLAVVLWLIVLTGVVQVWMVFALAIALGLRHGGRRTGAPRVRRGDGRPRAGANAVALNSAVGELGPHHRPGARRPAHRAGRRRMGVLRERGVVPRRVRRARSRCARRSCTASTATPRARACARGSRTRGRITEIRATILLVGVVGTLVYNFPTFLTLFASDTFHGGAGLAGLLMAILGVGTVIGALAAASPRASDRAHGRRGRGAARHSPCWSRRCRSQLAFEVALVPVGAMAVFFGSTANAHMQISSALALRGRVMAIYMLLTLGTTVVGGPFVGWICQHWSPRAGFAVAGLATLTASVLLSLPLTARLREPLRVPELAPD